jgi:hypothetical protein
MSAGNCPICNLPSQLDLFGSGRLDLYEVRCLRCGTYVITDFAKDFIERSLQLDNRGIAQYLTMGDSSGYRSETGLGIEVARKAANGRGMDVPRSIISHVLRKRMDKRTPFTCDILAGVLKNNSLPTPAEQANNFITYLGGYLSSPGSSFAVPAQQMNPSEEKIYGLLGIKTGSAEWNDLYFIITALDEQRILNVEYQPGMTTSGGRKIPLRVSLTLAGWQKYEELQRSVKDSRKAFVAMEFPNPDKTAENYFFQNTLLDKYLVPAAKKAGYDLANALRSEPKAGNLYARLEVEIRAARFVVAEISQHNNGAYWEAGFARGLGKPVIYMYNNVIGKSDRPHFDVGSDLYIPWELDKPEKAADDLKAVIRATLFGEAVMED